MPVAILAICSAGTCSPNHTTKDVLMPLHVPVLESTSGGYGSSCASRNAPYFWSANRSACHPAVGRVKISTSYQLLAPRRVSPSAAGVLRSYGASAASFTKSSGGIARTVVVRALPDDVIEIASFVMALPFGISTVSATSY
jgi:hypothetical protein